MIYLSGVSTAEPMPGGESTIPLTFATSSLSSAATTASFTQLDVINSMATTSMETVVWITPTSTVTGPPLLVGSSSAAATTTTAAEDDPSAAQVSGSEADQDNSTALKVSLIVLGAFIFTTILVIIWQASRRRRKENKEMLEMEARAASRSGTHQDGSFQVLKSPVVGIEKEGAQESLLGPISTLPLIMQSGPTMVNHSGADERRMVHHSTKRHIFSDGPRGGGNTLIRRTSTSGRKHPPVTPPKPLQLPGERQKDAQYSSSPLAPPSSPILGPLTLGNAVQRWPRNSNVRYARSDGGTVYTFDEDVHVLSRVATARTNARAEDLQDLSPVSPLSEFDSGRDSMIVKRVAR